MPQRIALCDLNGPIHNKAVSKLPSISSFRERDSPLTLAANTDTSVPSDEAFLEEEVAALPAPTWLPNGLPLFVDDSDQVIDRIIAEGYQIFYVLGIHQDFEDITPNYVGAPKKYRPGPCEPRLYKVINNLMAKAIIDVTDDNLGGVKNTTSAAYFLLPKLPYALVEKMDCFFRTVDKKLGTESIVVLTYDNRFRGTEDESKGWGLVVPNQTNTAGHCNYDPSSVLDMIPDDEQAYINIVGTAHSHPGMSAFASHTDHADQVGNDGIHITFGWKKNSATEHYIEMQVGDRTWTLTEEQAFSARPEADGDEEVEIWTDRVAKEVMPPKALTPATYTASSNTYGGTYSAPRHSQSKPWMPVGQAGKDIFGNWWRMSKLDGLQLPAMIPDPREAVLFINLLEGGTDKKCPVCGELLLAQDIQRRSCDGCFAFLLYPSENPETIRQLRKKTSGTDGLVARWDAALDPKTGFPVLRVIRFLDEQNNVKAKIETIFAPKKG